jgi:hypothetical protein
MRTYAAALGTELADQEHVAKFAKITQRMDAAVITTNSDVTYTAAQILGGIIDRDCNGSARSDVLPTAALLVQAMREEKVGDVVECLIVNNSDAAEAITIVAGDGGTVKNVAAARTVPQNTSRMIYIVITAIGAAPTYDVYM